MRKLEKRTKEMRALAAAFALVVGLTSFNGVSALAGRMKNNEVKKEYKTEDIEGSLLELGKKAVRVGENTYDVTLSVKDKSFEHEKKMPLANTDVVFVVDTSASMDEDNGWVQLKNVLGDKNKGLVYNILGNGNEESNNSVTFVGYGGGVFTYTPDYYISDKFTSNNIANAVAEYDSSKKMSSKIDGSKGGGNLIAGFEGAKQAIAKLKEDGRNQVVVLITDGDPSVGHRIYTLYSDSDEKPGEGWEPYRGAVLARYWKRVSYNPFNRLYKKYIYSKDLDAYNTDTEGLSDWGKDSEYKDTKWTKEVRTNLNSRIDIKDPRQIKYTLEKAEELKKLTSNDKIYTVNVKNIKSSLLEKDLFKKHYYNATVKETGETLYNDIYDDLFKVEKYNYKATGIKLHEELSDFVEFDEKENLVINIGENKVVLKPGTETYGVIPFAAEGENYGLGNVEIRYDKGDKSFNWTIAEGIPEGTTISLTYRVKLNKKAVKPGKGEDEDYKKNIQGLVNTDENTGDHAKKLAYPVSKENQSYVNYRVEEVDNKGNSQRLSGENLETKFPVAGVRPVIYEKKEGKVVVKDIFERYGEEAFVVTRLEETVDFNAEKKYSALTEKELVNKAGKEGYPDYVGSYTTITPEEKKVTVDKDTTSVEFRYTLKEENIDVYDHFNGGEGVYRQGYELSVGKGNKIEYAPELTNEAIKTMGKAGDWQVVKQDDGKSFKVETNEAGVRSVHFYYLQKAKLHVTHYYSDKEGEEDNKEEFIKDVLFTDKIKVAIRENKDNQIAQAIIKRGEDGSEIPLNFDSNKAFTDEFIIDNEDIYVELYYDYIPKDVVHTIRHIYEGSSDVKQEVYTKAYKEEDEYRYVALNKNGWRLKEGSKSEYNGIVSLEGQNEFTFTYMRDVVKVIVKDIVKDENGTVISTNIRYEGESEKNKTYKVDAISTVNSDLWEISPSHSIERILTNDEEIFEFVYQKKTKEIKISDKYGDAKASLRSTSKTAIDATFEVEPLLKDNWIVEKVTVNRDNKELEEGKLKVDGYDNKEIVFIYKDNSPSKPEIKPEPQEPSNPVVPTPEPQTPSDSTLPAPESPVVDVTEDTTPQGTAPTTPTNPSEDNTDETGIVDINEDDTPQGEADIEDDKTPKGIAKTTEKVKVEEDATPQGNAALPKTGGTNADIFGLIGLGLIGLGLAVKKRK
ncbi:MAG: VWA domain-containing protein [Catonella sp.]